MVVKKKKLEILNLDDIKSGSNDLLSLKSNHYLRNMLFCLRLLFRYNGDGLDDLIDFYYYIEDILNNVVLLDFDELKILIYRVTDVVVNLDDYDLNGATLISECASNLLHSLYLELETYRLVDKTDESPVWKDVLMGQLKNQVVDFNELILVLDICDDDVRGIVLNILENNYPFEFSVYKARHGILDF
ncbi:MAG: hypothetical protein BZ138_00480 [Methanosphaera sp. rholeuAM270]|nr:MAG: hypothetical protein BZ138_00480 [Methanosphaera sp. rholeuAM270]